MYEFALFVLIVFLVMLPALLIGGVIQLALRQRSLPEFGAWLAGALFVVFAWATGGRPPVQLMDILPLSAIASVLVSTRVIQLGAWIVRRVKSARARRLSASGAAHAGA